MSLSAGGDGVNEKNGWFTHVFLFFLPVSSPGADYGQISEETWQYLLGIYGGGPEIAVRQTVTPADPESLHGERKIEAETRAL